MLALRIKLMRFHLKTIMKNNRPFFSDLSQFLRISDQVLYELFSHYI